MSILTEPHPKEKEQTIKGKSFKSNRGWVLSLNLSVFGINKLIKTLSWPSSCLKYKLHYRASSRGDDGFSVRADAGDNLSNRVHHGLTGENGSITVIVAHPEGVIGKAPSNVPGIIRRYEHFILFGCKNRFLPLDNLADGSFQFWKQDNSWLFFIMRLHAHQHILNV